MCCSVTPGWWPVCRCKPSGSPASEGIPDEAQSLLVQLKHSSRPFFQKFKTLVEKPVPGHGLPLLPPESI